LSRAQIGKASDIDILVEIKKNLSLPNFIGLKVELEEALGKIEKIKEGIN